MSFRMCVCLSVCLSVCMYVCVCMYNEYDKHDHYDCGVIMTLVIALFELLLLFCCYCSCYYYCSHDALLHEL